MTTRTTLTTRSALNRLLAEAIAAGDLPNLYWFVEMRISPTLAGDKHPVISACAWPAGWVPVVAVGPDPVVSRHWADILLECMKSGNRGRLIEFGLALTTTQRMAAGRFPAYAWGEVRWDCVCVACGAVWVSTGINEEVCEECRKGMTDATTGDRNEGQIAAAGRVAGNHRHDDAPV